MPSSIIFAGLAVAWLVVLVPMVAKRRQEVVHTAESALAARVLHRPAHVVVDGRTPVPRAEEVPDVVERSEVQDRPVPEADRSYRPGRGGYDPDAAALAATARYAFRRRVVSALGVAAALSLVLGLVAAPVWWWVLAAAVLSLAGYLAYLRRQVRIEDEVRRRRAARLAGARRRRPLTPSAGDDVDPEQDHERTEVFERADEPHHSDVPAYAAPPGAEVVDLDDEDPAFDELDPSFEPRYRRAAGE